ncbi:MAG: hypothetical protein GWP19_06590 [Planctomycetia bacterium]|nr:hypothetical protein [Planctomycetia bacterium]
MVEIKKKYIVDSNNHRVGVQIDYNTYKLIEEILEDHALYNLMKKSDDEESLNISKAKSYYNQIKK